MSPAVVYVLAGFLVGVFGGTWKPFLGLKKPPPTAELTAAQADLAKAQLAVEQARKDAENAKATERAKLEAQIRSGQTDAAGVAAALRKAPQGPEVKLATSMAQRVEYKLALAIGDLPRADREAIVQLVEDALNGKQAEFDRAMARRDAEFALLAKERDEIRLQLPVLVQRAEKAESVVKEVQADVTAKTEEVKVWAAKTDAAERKAGGLFGAFASVRRWLFGVVGCAAVLAGLAIYLRMGLGSVGRALHPLKNQLPPETYDRLIANLDGRTDRLHQWLISTGRRAEQSAADHP